MTKRETALLACKILSLYLVVRLVGDLPETFRVGIPPLDRALTVYLLAVILVGAAAAALWVNADFVARHMVPEDASMGMQSNRATLSEMQRVAISLVGLVILVLRALPSLVSNLAALTWELVSPLPPSRSQMRGRSQSWSESSPKVWP